MRQSLLKNTTVGSKSRARSVARPQTEAKVPKGFPGSAADFQAFSRLSGLQEGRELHVERVKAGSAQIKKLKESVAKLEKAYAAGNLGESQKALAETYEGTTAVGQIFESLR